MTDRNDYGDEALHSGSRDERGRFLKGAPSANPRGAPRKEARSKSLTKEMDRMVDMVMRLARLPAAKRGDGTIIDRQERALDELYRLGTDPRNPSVRALVEYIRITQAAAAVEQKFLMDMLAGSYAYKEYWGPIFEEAEACGRPLPSTLPHPKDVEIDDDGTVHIVGPVDREGQRQMVAIVALRDIVLEGLAGFTDEERTSEPGRYLKRRLAKLNRALPPRLRKDAM